MLTRRDVLGTAGAGVAVVGSGLAWPKILQAQPAGTELTPASHLASAATRRWRRYPARSRSSGSPRAEL